MLLEVDRTEYEVSPLGIVGSGSWAVDVSVHADTTDGQGRIGWAVVGDRIEVGGVRHQPQRSDDRFGRLQRPGSFPVGGSGELPALPGMNHPDLHVLGDGHRRHIEAVAVDEQRVACHSGGGGQLIHDPARHPRGRLFGSSGELGQLHRVTFEAEGQCHRHLQGRAGGQARSHRQVRGHLPGEADVRSELVHHSGHVSGPARNRCRVSYRQGDPGFGPFGVAGEHHLGPAPVTRHRGGQVDRHRQHQTAGGVGVVTDQVHPSRRCRHDRGGAHVGHGNLTDLSAAAASSGSTGFRYSPLPSSAPAT